MVSRNNYKIEVMSTLSPPGEGDPMSLNDMDKRRAHRTHFHSFNPLLLLNSEWQCREEARARLSL